MQRYRLFLFLFEKFSGLLHIFLDGGLDLPCLLFVLRRLRGAIGLVAAPLGKMDQHPNRFLLGEWAVQRLGAHW